MTKVFKYPAGVYDLQAIEMPRNSKIISASTQSGNINIYAMVDDEEKQKELRYIRIAGTGHPLKGKGLTSHNTGRTCEDINHMQFIGTVSLANGSLVFHVYEAIMTR
jgi:hypothetical protein